jgi:hypothetical protein
MEIEVELCAISPFRRRKLGQLQALTVVTSPLKPATFGTDLLVQIRRIFFANGVYSSPILVVQTEINGETDCNANNIPATKSNRS